MELPADNQTVPLVAPELGFNIYTLQVSIRIVPPRYQESTVHSHGEAVHYYVAGRGRQMVGDQRLEVKAGDLAFIPAGARHSIANPGNEPLRVLEAEQIPGTYLQIPTPWRDPA